MVQDSLGKDAPQACCEHASEECTAFAAPSDAAAGPGPLGKRCPMNMPPRARRLLLRLPQPGVTEHPPGPGLLEVRWGRVLTQDPTPPSCASPPRKLPRWVGQS
eukprot:220711-Chlamydomonas_euryale.AAC.2